MNTLADFCRLDYEMQKSMLRVLATEIDSDIRAGFDSSIKKFRLETLLAMLVGGTELPMPPSSETVLPGIDF